MCAGDQVEIRVLIDGLLVRYSHLMPILMVLVMWKWMDVRLMLNA